MLDIVEAPSICQDQGFSAEKVMGSFGFFQKGCCRATGFSIGALHGASEWVQAKYVQKRSTTDFQDHFTTILGMRVLGFDVEGLREGGG